MARQQARRHQRERVAGIALAVLGAIVLIVALIALRDPNGRNASSSGSPTTVITTTSRSASAPGDSSAKRSPSKSASRSGPSLNLDSTGATKTAALKSVPLVVLNNSTITGLASQAAQRFRDGGWKVSDTGNLQNNIISTCAYYDSSVADAKSAAEALQRQYPTIKRVQPKFAELPAGPVVVVLTSDYSSG